MQKTDVLDDKGKDAGKRRQWSSGLPRVRDASRDASDAKRKKKNAAVNCPRPKKHELQENKPRRRRTYE